MSGVSSIYGAKGLKPVNRLALKGLSFRKKKKPALKKAKPATKRKTKGSGFTEAKRLALRARRKERKARLKEAKALIKERGDSLTVKEAIRILESRDGAEACLGYI